MPTREKIANLRKRLGAAGYLGVRSQLFVGKPFEFPFPPYMASLIVSEDATAAGFSFDVNPARLFESLRPYGGTLCLNLPQDMAQRFVGWAARAGAANARPGRAGDWHLLTREGGLAGIGPVDTRRRGRRSHVLFARRPGPGAPGRALVWRYERLRHLEGRDASAGGWRPGVRAEAAFPQQ